MTVTCTAFAGTRAIASGPLIDVALQLRAEGRFDGVLVFDDDTGVAVDLDLRGSAEDVAARLVARQAAPLDEPVRAGRGRPKLGVVAREVTLLPRHWEWLAAQPGGASVTLRRLVEQARRSEGGDAPSRRRGQEAAYRFMTAMAGDLPGYEEACRALFAGDDRRFAQQIERWPDDVRAHASRLARHAFA